MENRNSYLAVAEAYSDGVRNLFAPSGAPTGERGEPGPASPADLAAQAEKLAPLSSSLTAEAANRVVSSTDPADRAQASTQLLAKALTDLKVSAHLLQAAEDEANNAWSQDSTKERGISDAGGTEELLQIVLGEAPSTFLTRERGAPEPQDIGSARLTLSQTIEDTLALRSERTSKTGQAALGGLFGIGLGQVGQAAGLLGQNIGQAFGQADRLSRLYSLFRDFAQKAYESVLALLGPAVAKIAGQQVLDWLAEVKEAKFFGTLLEKLYQTKQTQEALLATLKKSEAEREKFVIAIAGVEGLSETYLRQLGLVDKLLKGLRYLGAVPVAVLPYGSLLMATTYVAICSYVVLNGADYVDAEHVKWLNRVPGVRQVVEIN